LHTKQYIKPNIGRKSCCEQSWEAILWGGNTIWSDKYYATSTCSVFYALFVQFTCQLGVEAWWTLTLDALKEEYVTSRNVTAMKYSNAFDELALLDTVEVMEESTSINI
jgi:hypothetical protein